MQLSAAVSEELRNKVKEPSFFRDVMNLIKENNISLSSMGDDHAVRERFSVLFEEQKRRLDNWVKTKGVDAASEKLLAYLESKSFWFWLQKQLDSAIGKLREMTEQKIHSEEFRKTVNDLMLQFAAKIILNAKKNAWVQVTEILVDITGIGEVK